MTPEEAKETAARRQFEARLKRLSGEERKQFQAAEFQIREGVRTQKRLLLLTEERADEEEKAKLAKPE